MLARGQLTTTCTHVGFVLVKDSRTSYCEEVIPADHSSIHCARPARNHGPSCAPKPIKVNERQKDPGGGQPHQEPPNLRNDLIVPLISELLIGYA
jgi:hypothetical protein